DDLGPRGFGELERRDRHAAGALHDDHITRLRVAYDEQRTPCGQGCARQRGRLEIAEFVRHARHAVLVKQGVGARDAVERAAEVRARHAIAAAADPSLREKGRDALAHFDAGTASTSADPQDSGTYSGSLVNPGSAPRTPMRSR